MSSLFAAVAVPAETQPPLVEKPRCRPRFWVGPLVAGSCFALGFGITQRIVAMQGGESAPKPQAFNPKPFPGVGLQILRDRFEGASKPLKANVAAREAELAKTRPPKPKKVDLAKKEAERLAAEARRLQQQTATRWARAVLPAAVVPAAVEPLDESELIPAPELPEALVPEEPMPEAANALALEVATPELLPVVEEPGPLLPAPTVAPVAPAPAPAASELMEPLAPSTP